MVELSTSDSSHVTGSTSLGGVPDTTMTPSTKTQAITDITEKQAGADVLNTAAQALQSTAPPTSTTTGVPTSASATQAIQEGGQQALLGPLQGNSQQLQDLLDAQQQSSPPLTDDQVTTLQNAKQLTDQMIDGLQKQPPEMPTQDQTNNLQTQMAAVNDIKGKVAFPQSVIDKYNADGAATQQQATANNTNIATNPALQPQFQQYTHDHPGTSMPDLQQGFAHAILDHYWPMENAQLAQVANELNWSNEVSKNLSGVLGDLGPLSSANAEYQFSGILGNQQLMPSSSDIHDDGYYYDSVKQQWSYLWAGGPGIAAYPMSGGVGAAQAKLAKEQQSVTSDMNNCDSAITKLQNFLDELDDPNSEMAKYVNSSDPKITQDVKDTKQKIIDNINQLKAAKVNLQSLMDQLNNVEIVAPPTSINYLRFPGAKASYMKDYPGLFPLSIHDTSGTITALKGPMDTVSHKYEMLGGSEQGTASTGWTSDQYFSIRFKSPTVSEGSIEKAESTVVQGGNAVTVDGEQVTTKGLPSIYDDLNAQSTNATNMSQQNQLAVQMAMTEYNQITQIVTTVEQMLDQMAKTPLRAIKG